MKAQEFRIGNLYQPTDGTSGYMAVTAEDILAWSRGAIYGKPITLTPELVERLGGRRSLVPGPYHVYLEKDFTEEVSMKVLVYPDSFQLIGRREVKDFDQEFDGRVSAKSFHKVNYLHQLQNFCYGGCGIELYIDDTLLNSKYRIYDYGTGKEE